MKPIAGPRQLKMLQLLLERGPLTPREMGALLNPDAAGRSDDGAGRSAGKGKGFTSGAGKANRGAGAMLGRMHRAGWVKPGQGRRFHIAYEITPEGQQEAVAATARLAADPVIGPDDPVPTGRRRCNRCGRARLPSSFPKDRHNRSGLHARCRDCHQEQQAERRSALMLDRDATATWTRASKEVIVKRTLALLKVARQARHVGTWRGKEGVRAYAALGEALDSFANDYDPSLNAAEVVDPHDDEPPEAADPADTIWDPAVHSNGFFRIAAGG